jgi:hypothetical protein
MLHREETTEMDRYPANRDILPSRSRNSPFWCSIPNNPIKRRTKL